LTEQVEKLAQVHTIFPLNRVAHFSEEEAYQLVNLFIAVTQKAKKNINGLNSQLEYHKAIPHEADALQQRINLEIHKWSEKIKRLGGTPLSLFKVKIPAEIGYFIWEFPSAEIEHHF
jgi:hypothetical protein